MLICGIDEAGRGPVIGPLVMCGVLVEQKDEEKLKNIGVKDSKLLTPNQREGLFKKITGIAKRYKLLVIPPREIDMAVESDKINLNKLEAMKSAWIINYLSPDVAYIDCPSNNINNYTDYLKKYIFNGKIRIIAEHKADFKYPTVSAASILAKVTRDNEIGKIKKKIGIDIGSGYPSDEVTIRFLKKHHESYPEIIRKSWATYREIKKDQKQKKLGGY